MFDNAAHPVETAKAAADPAFIEAARVAALVRDWPVPVDLERAMTSVTRRRKDYAVHAEALREAAIAYHSASASGDRSPLLAALRDAEVAERQSQTKVAKAMSELRAARESCSASFAEKLNTESAALLAHLAARLNDVADLAATAMSADHLAARLGLELPRPLAVVRGVLRDIAAAQRALAGR
jgi:hypothetical protein